MLVYNAIVDMTCNIKFIMPNVSTKAESEAFYKKIISVFAQQTNILYNKPSQCAQFSTCKLKILPNTLLIKISKNPVMVKLCDYFIDCENAFCSALVYEAYFECKLTSELLSREMLDKNAECIKRIIECIVEKMLNKNVFSVIYGDPNIFAQAHCTNSLHPNTVKLRKNAIFNIKRYMNIEIKNVNIKQLGQHEKNMHCEFIFRHEAPIKNANNLDSLIKDFLGKNDELGDKVQIHQHIEFWLNCVDTTVIFDCIGCIKDLDDKCAEIYAYCKKIYGYCIKMNRQIF